MDCSSWMADFSAAYAEQVMYLSIILIVGFVMGFAIIPIIYTIAEDALSAVPEHLRAASLGAGATLAMVSDLAIAAENADIMIPFASIDPAAFSRVFVAWAKILIARLELTGTHIAVDGKTSRRSFGRDENGKKTTPLHTVSAWMSDAGLVMGQQKTADKSNEITAIPELLGLLDIRGATVTIDAMGCQTEIAKTIIDSEARSSRPSSLTPWRTGLTLPRWRRMKKTLNNEVTT